MSAVCPALYRDEKGRFICEYSGSVVDPALMPCMSDFASCPIFMRHKEEGEAAVAVEKETPEAAEVVVETTYKTVELLDRLSAIESEILKLDSFWSTYEKEANETLDKWSEIREEVLLRLSSIDRMVQSLLDEDKELDSLRKLGLIEEPTYLKEKEEIKSKLDALEEERKRLAEYLERIEKEAEAHYRRVRVVAAKADIGRLKLSLMKLDQLLETGEIDQRTYDRLRAEIKKEIEKLEKLV